MVILASEMLITVTINNSQDNKEAIAINFAVKFILQTNHHTLSTIFDSIKGILTYTVNKI